MINEVKRCGPINITTRFPLNQEFYHLQNLRNSVPKNLEAQILQHRIYGIVALELKHTAQTTILVSSNKKFTSLHQMKDDSGSFPVLVCRSIHKTANASADLLWRRQNLALPMTNEVRPWYDKWNLRALSKPTARQNPNERWISETQW